MEQTTYDVVIVGCGPAGLSAAINCRIREKNFLLLGGDFCTAKLHKAPHVENYLGFHDVSGELLRQNFLNHIESMGIEITKGRVDSIYPLGDTIQLMSGEQVIAARSVIIASGLSVPNYIPGEKELVGKGVGYCATCDGPLYRGKKVLVLAETAEAQEEANFLSEVCESVTYVSLHGKPEHLKAKVNIIEAKALKVKGEKTFQALETDRGILEADGLFIIREVKAVQDILPGLDLEGSFIKVDRALATNIPGVYAAGDCTGPPYQVAKSVGEGLVAALNAVKYLDR